MIRNLKALCLAGLAALALSAVVASGASAAEFTSVDGNYPTTVSGTSTADVFDAFGSTVKCTNNSFSGTAAGKSTDLTISPSYNSCTAFGLPATVSAPAGAFTFTSDGTVHVAKEITINIYSSSSHATVLCVVHIAPQTPTGKVTYTNTGSGTTADVDVSGNVSGISATQTRNSILCPSGESTTTATYTIQSAGITIQGKFGGVSEGIHVK